MNVKAMLLLILLPVALNAAETRQASEAQAVTVAIYDQGFALVQELRRVSLSAGETEVVFTGLPRRLDPSTTAFTVTGGARQVDLLEQAFRTNAAGAELRWLLLSDSSGPVTLRITYRTDGMNWRAAHELTLSEGADQARLLTRVALDNQCGHTFSNARVRLVVTERGAAPKLPIETGSSGTSAAHRFDYGASTAMPERLVAGLATLQTHELPDPVVLPDATSKFVSVGTAEKLAASRVHVYDGVRFDRYQRNRQTDWSLGTECNNAVDAFYETELRPDVGLPLPLPPGRIRLTQKREDGTLDFLGESDVSAVATGAVLRVRAGPSRGLIGERERTGYTEVRPAREYDESFEIRIRNEGITAATVRVVEHLYRGADHEIVKADTEYARTDPQTIEFTPQVRAGGQRTIRYTVRYRW